MFMRFCGFFIWVVLVFQVNGAWALDTLTVDVGRVIFHPGENLRANVLVSVGKSNGSPVSGLEQKDFEIRENGGAAFSPVTVAPLIETEKKLVYMILMDVQAESPTSLTYMKKTVNRFLLDLGYRYPGLVMRYVDTPRFITEWGDSPKRMEEAVSAQKPDGGSPCMADGLIHGLRRLSDITAGKDGNFEQPVFILFTDGRDQGSLFSLEAAETMLLESGVSLFVIWYGPKRNAITSLAALAAKTAGGAYYASNPEELPQKIGLVTERLKNLYRVTYISNSINPHNQAYNLEVRVQAGDRIGIGAQGYITPPVTSKPAGRLLGGLLVGAIAFLLAGIVFLVKRTNKGNRETEKPVD